MMFYLKYYDKTLISFEIIQDPLDGQLCQIISTDDANSQFFPIGMQVTDQGLMK